MKFEKYMNWKSKKFAISSMAIFLTALLFYRYEIRPGRIMHACSWIREGFAALPADPGVTVEDVDLSIQRYKDCIKTNPPHATNPGAAGFSGQVMIDECSIGLKEYRAPTPAQSESYRYRQASKSEYDFCLHDKGLK
ncbi:hypothetical protein KW785_02750 [Candidatus Parcubacteria bacterium]|nr:hypothetical protein [Candidatus Parcubacteria bacterium]